MNEIPPPVQYWRVPHDIERLWEGGPYGGDGYRAGKARERTYNPADGKYYTIPEVNRADPDQTTPLDCDYIRLWRSMLPLLTLEQFILLFDNSWALFNGTGWPGRYNCLTGADKGKGLPNFHAALVCSGAVLKQVRIENGFVWVESLSAGAPAPSLEFMEKNKHLWFWGTQVNHDGQVTYLTRGQTNGVPNRVRVPLVTSKPIGFPATHLHKLPLGFFPPNALWMPG